MTIEKENGAIQGEVQRDRESASQEVIVGARGFNSSAHDVKVFVDGEVQQCVVTRKSTHSQPPPPC